MHLIGKHKDKVKLTEVKDEKGRVSGYQAEDNQGRVAAVARPQPVRGKAGVDGS